MDVRELPRLLTAREVADVLQVGVERVRDLVRDDELRAVRLTPKGHMRFRAEDVARLIDGDES